MTGEVRRYSCFFLIQAYLVGSDWNRLEAIQISTHEIGFDEKKREKRKML